MEKYDQEGADQTLSMMIPSHTVRNQTGPNHDQSPSPNEN